MAARDFEAVQKALRKPDYEDEDEDDDDDEDSSEDEGDHIILSTGSISSSPERQTIPQTVSSPIGVAATSTTTNTTNTKTSAAATATSTATDSATTALHFDPYAAFDTSIHTPNSSKKLAPSSLVDDDSSVHTVSPVKDTIATQNHSPTAMSSSVPGGAGYLEMEEEPPRLATSSSSYSGLQNLHHDPSADFWEDSGTKNRNHNTGTVISTNTEHEPIRTSSGLILTHRRPTISPSNHNVGLHRPTPVRHSMTMESPDIYDNNNNGNLAANGNMNNVGVGTSTVRQSNGMHTVFDKSDPLMNNHNATAATSSSGPKQRAFFEVEHGFAAWRASTNMTTTDYMDNLHGNHRKHSMPMLQARRFLSFARIWMVLCTAFLMVATGVLFHAFGHHNESTSVISNGSGNNKNVATSTNQVMAATTSSGTGTGTSTSGSYVLNGKHQVYTIGGRSDTPMSNQNQNQIQNGAMDVTQQIILVPLEEVSDASRRQQVLFDSQQQEQSPRQYQLSPPNLPQGGPHRMLSDLRQDFEQWVSHHRKKYRSTDEKEHRFRIWAENHHRTLAKNERHGRCRMTQQAVFGSNHFQDLSQDEFKAQFLTGYTPAKQDDDNDDNDENQTGQLSSHMRQLGVKNNIVKQKKGNKRKNVKTLTPDLNRSSVHESIKMQIAEKLGDRQLTKKQSSSTTSTNTNSYTMRKANCDWYDVACVLRWLWNAAGVQFGSVVGTMEPKYDSSAFPNAIDWRDYGVVTSVRSQGNCGACWAITAVETVESAHAISTGNLYDLSETEIITCDDSCDMCSGGWPQNAFEWVMKYGGLPLYNTYPYDGDKLLSMTSAVTGESDGFTYYYFTEDSVKSYQQQVCPADGNDGSHSSGDQEDAYWNDGSENKNYNDNSDKGRYGNIKGYGYATDRCICYSDGSGCSCDDQDEELAVANIATYGPAVVCVDASLWQDYSGGIMTADIGCGSGFMDVNHCVQVVGYAFTDGSDGDNGDEGGGGSGSGDANGNENGKREGYWIVRNQWGGYWGMNGYAYVAMGTNTCGILNDMTQAYL